jgi:hypothetical protein
MENLAAWLIGLLISAILLSFPAPPETPENLPTPMPTVTPIPEEQLADP